MYVFVIKIKINSKIQKFDSKNKTINYNTNTNAVWYILIYSP